MLRFSAVVGVLYNVCECPCTKDLVVYMVYDLCLYKSLIISANYPYHECTPIPPASVEVP